uniref:protein-tyrosine-phosphatase n=1 Tax=Trichuris muris TaxID=70415 RepID=A0A5S6Q9U8_TRIMR
MIVGLTLTWHALASATHDSHAKFRGDQPTLPGLLSLHEDNDQLLSFERHSENYVKMFWDISQFPYCDYFNISSLTQSGKHEYGSIAKETIHREGFAVIKAKNNERTEISLSCRPKMEYRWQKLLSGVVDLTRPSSVQNFKILRAMTDESQKSSISFEWLLTDHDDPTHYRLILSYHLKTNVNAHKYVDVSSLNSITVYGLNPSTTYVAAIVNMSSLGIASVPASVEQTTPPLISSVLEAERITKKSLLIKFTPTDADGALFDKYYLELLISEKVNATVSRSRGSRSRSVLFKGLLPGRRYLCRLFTVCRGIRSEPVTQVFTTYPDKIQRLRIISRPTSVKLFWQHCGDNMPYIRYRIACFNPLDGRDPLVVETTKDNLLVEKLKSSTWYTFSATVIADDLESDTEAVTVMTVGQEATHPVQFRRLDQTAAVVSFGRNLFTDSNGVVDQYSIIVAEDEQLDKFDFHHLRWKAVQKYHKWPPYLAYSVKRNPFSNPKVQSSEYLIGAEECDNELGYCNGPLRATSQYFVKIRGCSVAMICMETGYTALSSETPANGSEGSQAVMITAIFVAGVFVSRFLLA